MWLFLLNEILFFGGFFCAYAWGRYGAPEAFTLASRRLDVVLAGIESVVLIVSGLLVALALRAIRLDRPRGAWRLLACGAALGLLFLALHGKEYLTEFHEGLVPGLHFRWDGVHDAQAQLFFFLYYAMTLFHALHVAVGVVLLGWLALRTRRGHFDAGHHPQIEMVCLYWQFVDVVWMFLFPLFYLVDRST
nr:cytochrome c oxidase subunit 3 [Coralloluteibacterium stylophorae]